MRLGKSLEDREYKKFYFMQWIIFVSSIAKGTAIGFITYKLNLTSMQLAVFAAMSTLGALGSYFISPYLRANSRNLELFFISTQALNFVFSLIGLGYSSWCYFNDSWGNFYIWLVLNFFLCLSIYLEPTARSIYVKKRFPNFDFAAIIKSDVFTMGGAKILGFAAGVFITSMISVVVVFLLNLLNIIWFWQYLTGELKKRPFRKVFSLDLNSVGELAPVIEKSFNFRNTVMLFSLNAFFFAAINTQSVTYAKMWDIPFYVFPVVSSIGNILFSIFLNAKLDLSLKNGFEKYLVITVLGGLLIYFCSGLWVLLGFFLLGGVFSTMHVYSNARMYSSEEGKSTKVVAAYYLSYNILFAIASLLFGFAMTYVSPPIFFLVLGFLAPVCFWLVKRIEVKT